MSNYIEMTNEEIWEMLKPKMEKNGLKTKVSIVHIPANWRGESLPETRKTYYEDEVHNAIALAYKVGYLRAMKGRPFKISEKKVEEKKGGYWKPVDPNNLPKEGTKVRYGRECGKYNNDIIKIGDTGTVVFEGIFTPLWFGMKPDKIRSGRTWLDFSEGDENCLDVWVEDDE